LELRWLHDFLVLAETGNFTRAAALRHTSQAAFSRRIQQLEGWLGATLIDRGMFPTRLTPEGEIFKRVAGEMLRQAADVRAEISDRASRSADQIRLALPYALATSHLPTWWPVWSRGGPLTLELSLGNVQDLGDALSSGSADLTIGFESTLQPIDMGDGVESIIIGEDQMRPYASRKLLNDKSFSWPGAARTPVPMLSYSPGVYFARLVDLTLKGLPERIESRSMLTSDMADVLRDMARQGVGVAWLPDATAGALGDDLIPLPGDALVIPLAIKAFRRVDNVNRATWRLWEILKLVRAEAA
jgi:DNA-binding transcriptional LysR family regulator